MEEKNIKLTKSNPRAVSTSIYLFLSILIVLTAFTPIVEAQTNNTTAMHTINDNSELARLLYEREQERFNQAETNSRNIGELNQALKDTMIGRNNALRVMFINPEVNLDNQGRATSWRLKFFDEYKKTMRENTDLLSNGFAHNTERWIYNAQNT